MLLLIYEISPPIQKLKAAWHKTPECTNHLEGIASGIYSLTAENGGKKSAVMVTVAE